MRKTAYLVSAMLLSACATEESISHKAVSFQTIEGHGGHYETDSSVVYNHTSLVIKGDTIVREGFGTPQRRQNCYVVSSGGVIESCGGLTADADSVRMYDGKIYVFKKDCTIIDW